MILNHCKCSVFVQCVWMYVRKTASVKSVALKKVYKHLKDRINSINFIHLKCFWSVNYHQDHESCCFNAIHIGFVWTYDWWCKCANSYISVWNCELQQRIEIYPYDKLHGNFKKRSLLRLFFIIRWFKTFRNMIIWTSNPF